MCSLIESTTITSQLAVLAKSSVLMVIVAWPIPTAFKTPKLTLTTFSFEVDQITFWLVAFTGEIWYVSFTSFWFKTMVNLLVFNVIFSTGTINS